MKLPYRILVLDDDESALAGIVEMLRDGGYVVTPAETYEGAKRLLALEGYDLLIPDIRLARFQRAASGAPAYRDRPEMGLVIIYRLRRADDGSRSGPVRRGVRSQANQAGRIHGNRRAHVSPMSGVSAAGRESASSADSA